MTELPPDVRAVEQLLRYWNCSADDHHAMCVAEQIVRDAAAGDAISQTELRCSTCASRATVQADGVVS